MDETPTRKRQRPLASNADTELTPRPLGGSVRSATSTSIPDSAPASIASSALRSRSSSPKKQLMGLRLDDDGLDLRQLDDDAAPSAATVLLSTLTEIGSGHDILPDDRRGILQSGALRHADVRTWRYSFKPAGDEDMLPGRIPTVEEVVLVREMARWCHDLNHEEAGWNTEVHHPILKAVFREPGQFDEGLLNATVCSSARPHSQYVPQSTPAKLVDFCIYAYLGSDAKLLAAQQALCRRMPTLSVNHTDFPLLQLRPIVLSIETKKPGKELDAAQLQIGVWHAAHWSFLKSAVGMLLQARRQTTGGLSAAERIAQAAEVETALSRLAFLPGIIIQGHRWSVVLSTREGKRTVLWVERQFGSTQSVREIYQIIAGIRELAGWCRDVYLPWYREHVLLP